MNLGVMELIFDLLDVKALLNLYHSPRLRMVKASNSSCPETPRAPPNTKPRLNTTTSTDHKATAMAPIDNVIKDLKSRDPGEHSTLREVTEKYQVNRSTLGRRWRGVTASQEDRHLNQQALN